jgi:multidrug efflux pump subunit AcrB
LLSAFGFSMNSFVLGGIAAGVGSAVDPVILLSEKLRRCRDYSQARKALPDIRGPLVAGAATTVAALLPLLGLETGADPVVWTIGAVTLTALVLSLSIAPPLLLWDIGRPRAGPRRLSSEIWRKAQRAIKTFSYLAFRIARRCLAVNVRLCVRHPVWICIAAFVLTSGGIIALVVRGTDSGASGSEDSVYGHIEFDGGLLAVETDRRLAVYGQALAEERGIVNVQTGARTGTGSLLISFDPKQINADKARTMARSIPIPGGFLFFPETSANERHWEIKISGDDDRRCRELAEVLARSCAALPKIGERVLNFKDGSKRLKLAPKREILSHSGISFMRAADTMRRGVHGPVAYKRIGTSGETDVRIRIGSGDAHTAEQAGYLPDESVLPGLLMYSGDENAKPLRMDSLLNREEGLEPSSIRREDRRRTASITVSTIPVDPRRVKAELKEVFEKMELPPGYSVEFDPEAIKKAQKLSGTFLSFLLALAFCYMVIASVNESFSVPLAVLSAVPPSLAVPALCIAIGGRPFNSAAACAFVAVSGMAVNASVLCAAGLRPFLESKQRERSLKLYLALRRRIPALFATTLTTVAGALPFLLLREGSNNLVRTLSLVTSLGVGSSCFCSISIVPAISLILKKITFFSGK